MKRVCETARISTMLILLVGLSACGGKGIQDRPEDMNVSPRSQEAYDPTYRALENDPVEGKKQQQ